MKTVQQELARVPAASLKRAPSPEDRAREALDWALDNTCLTIPLQVRDPYAWQWDSEDAALHCLTDEGDFRFHVAGERRGRLRIRTAVLSWEDDDGKATWEADMPAEDA